MKIRLALLDEDLVYLNRIVPAFNSRYADKLELYSFTSKDLAIQSIVESKIDVLLANEHFDIELTELPSRCGFAYLTDQMGVETIKGEQAISKFQKADNIYKQVLSIYAEKASATTGMASMGGNGKLISFVSLSGGTGSSVAAASFATNVAKMGKKVFYLNLETLGDSEVFFSGEGQGDFGDIIYAVKSKKTNLYLKVESTVKQDIASGVYYFAATKLALDLLELKEDELFTIVHELLETCGYEYVVLDLDFKFNKETLNILKKCNEVVVVSDGSEIANCKIVRAVNALRVMEQNSEDKMLNRMHLLYNRFSSKTSNTLEGIDMNELGGIKRYEGLTTKQIVEQISQLRVFDALM